MSEITYREFSLRDEQKVLSLFEASFGRRRDLAQWRWEFFGGPEKSIIVLAENESEIVGHYAILPRMLRSGNDVMKAGIVVDVMTHPQYGRRGIFASSAIHAFEIAKAAGISVLLGFPNEAAIKGHRKVGWSEIGYVRVFVRPLSASALSTALRGRLRLPALVSKGLDAILSLITKSKPIGEARGVKMTCMSASSLTSLGDELGHFIKDAFPGSALRGERSVEWLKWRLADPLGVHWAVVARETGTSKLVGVTILKMKEYKGMRICAILDVIVKERDQDVESLLLKNAIRKARSEGCEICLMFGSPSDSRLLTLMGSTFMPSPKRLKFIVRTVEGAPLAANLRDIRNWHLQLIDHDVI
jgi:hypothetical protein